MIIKLLEYNRYFTYYPF